MSRSNLTLRLWRNSNRQTIDFASLSAPDIRTILYALYGPAWMSEAARHCGIGEAAVYGWVRKGHFPRRRLVQLREFAMNPRRLEMMRYRLIEQVEAEMAYRADAQAYALRWLRLMSE